MSLRDLFNVIQPNPDLVGLVRVTRDEIDQDKLDLYESKLRRARAYLTERNLKVRPICRTLPEAPDGSGLVAASKSTGERTT